MAKQQANRATRKESTTETSKAGGASAGAEASSAGGAASEAEEDHLYGLASVLYHALQGVTASRKYAEDARRAGIDELVEFFEECAREGSARAKQAKELLVTYSEESDDEGEEDEEDDT